MPTPPVVHELIGECIAACEGCLFRLRALQCLAEQHQPPTVLADALDAAAQALCDLQGAIADSRAAVLAALRRQP